MKYLLAFMLIFLVINLYLGVKSTIWANEVASKYMIAHYETTRCNKYRVDRATGNAICHFDKIACTKAKELWEDYEQSRANYYNWFSWF